MNHLNRTVIIGNLTRDPELIQTNNNQDVCKFSIANNRTYTSNGQKVEETSFFDVITWAKLAEICNGSLKKGKMVAVEGRLKQQRWKDQNGNKRSKVEIVADQVQFLSPRENTGNPQQNNQQPQNNSYDPIPPKSNEQIANELFVANESKQNDDDIPF